MACKIVSICRTVYIDLLALPIFPPPPPRGYAKVCVRMLAVYLILLLTTGKSART